jgi:hypothetical protein
MTGHSSEQARERTPNLIASHEVIERLRAERDALLAEAATLRAAIERAEQAKRLWREILRAWALGRTDAFQTLMFHQFIREFGKAPDLAAAQEPAEWR